MKRLAYSVVFCLVVGWSAVGWAQPIIDVVYPKPGQTLTASDSSFIFGNVTPPGARLWINGQSVPVHSNGAFLAFLPLKPGPFVFRCIAVADQETARVDLPVDVPAPPALIPQDSLAIDTLSCFPQEPLLLQAGDRIAVYFRATPGKKAWVFIGQQVRAPAVPAEKRAEIYWGEAVFGERLAQLVNDPSLYAAEIPVPAGVQWKDVPIRVVVEDSLGRFAEYRYGSVTIAGGSLPRVAELIRETTVLRTGPDAVYELFLPRGTRLVLTGKWGNFWRVRLNARKNAWLQDGAFRWLPSSFPFPRSRVPVVRVTPEKRKTLVKIPLSQRLPFQVQQRRKPSGLTIILWGATAETDWIRFDRESPVVKDIRWRQADSETFVLDIELAIKQQWGYLARYDGTNFILEIRHPPKISRGWFRSPLRGRVIVLDPGHHPDKGAVGPTRLEEREVNWAIARELKKMLERKGATVYLTRDDRQGIALMARPKFAALVEADVLISIHNNALPDGVNPFQHNGTSVYYYHPQSYDLARILHRHLLRALRLPDHGLYYANLALCRPTYMPAVLVEPAFMMLPEQEALLRDPAFQRKIARALLKGLEEFFRTRR